MYRKLFAASVLTIGLATSAMAQSSDGTSSNHRSWWPFGNEQSSTVDQTTTGCINADGKWHDELADGRDRPQTEVSD
jgi:hypothetical protein